jgi:two-component system, OmpR family, phosphate regulon sensor histidine kinase PhoR
LNSTFTKLLGLFLALLVVYTLALAVIFRRFVAPATIREGLLAALIALAAALLISDWVAGRISARVSSVITAVRRIRQGDWTAQIAEEKRDELSAIEEALKEATDRLGTDIAELESRRSELATMLDAMQEAVISISADGQVRWFNSVMQRIAGSQIYAGRPLVHSVRDPELLACVRGALERGEVSTGRATNVFSGRVFEVNAVPLPSGGALAVLHDVTGIEAAQKVRRDFVANVSHELRTPLTSIQGYVETLIDDPSPNPEMTLEFLGVILKSAARMNRLTEDLLALATVESPDYKLNLHPMRASALVDDAIKALRGIVVDSGVELESVGAPDAQILADPDALNQVFGNLVENSAKYASQGKRIKVGARLCPNEVQFTVQDFGPGIASEHLDRIFERFYRADKARSRESGGTGLGLAIVKHLVQAHGGRVWAESELGSGARFHFTIPLAQQVAEPQAAHDAAQDI